MSRRWDERDSEADGSPFPYLVALEAIVIGGLVLLGTGMMLASGVRRLIGLFG
ncbi:hypothetical protein [Sphingobium bisphenolivorans]|uniref:hypothetical protein n=1 Tax=Sphingobium bisphenolivorans TaxID=1335760 RepID=UPI0003A5108B|nr:hypothetical protein [Sphingobium bisphenolivorans]